MDEPGVVKRTQVITLLWRFGLQSGLRRDLHSLRTSFSLFAYLFIFFAMKV